MANLTVSQARAAEYAELSRYPYKGRMLDTAQAPTGAAHQSAVKMSVGESQKMSQHGKSTPGFGPFGKQFAEQWQPALSDVATDGDSQVEVQLACDDELLDIEAGDASSSASYNPPRRSRSSSPAASARQEAAQVVRGAKPKAATSVVSTESSAGSCCSTPRSVDTESMPWQEGPRSSSASSSSGAGATRANAALKQDSLLDDGDLQAEVQELLLQYKLDNERSRPEEGSVQSRKPKMTNGPELSSKSAWIRPDTLASQQP